MNTLEKKNIDWANLGFGYMKTDYRLSLILKTANGTRAQLQQMKILQ